METDAKSFEEFIAWLNDQLANGISPEAISEVVGGKAVFVRGRVVEIDRREIASRAVLAIATCEVAVDADCSREFENFVIPIRSNVHAWEGVEAGDEIRATAYFAPSSGPFPPFEVIDFGQNTRVPEIRFSSGVPSAE